MLGKDTEVEKEEVPSIGYKEFCALKKAKYGEIAGKYNKVFILKKKKTDQVVELRAASAFHACKMIGWKPKQVTLIEEKEVDAENKEQEEQADTSNVEEETNTTGAD